MHHYLKFLLFTGWGLFLREPGRHCRIPTPRDTADVIDSAIDLEDALHDASAPADELQDASTIAVEPLGLSNVEKDINCHARADGAINFDKTTSDTAHQRAQLKGYNNDYAPETYFVSNDRKQKHGVGSSKQRNLSGCESQTAWLKDKPCLKSVEWNEMLKSENLLAEDIEQIDREVITEAKGLDSIFEATDILRTLHNQLWHFLGAPEASFDVLSNTKTLSIHDIPQASLSYYKQCILELVLMVHREMELPAKFFHLQILKNDCILTTIQYLYKYDLVPAEIKESIKSDLTSEAGLEWIALEIISIFLCESMFLNSFHTLFHSEEFIKIHFQLSRIYWIFQSLRENEKDLVLFYCLGANYMEEVTDNGSPRFNDSEEVTRAIKSQILFFQKAQSYFTKGITATGHDEQAKKSFLLEIRSIIIDLAKFLREPKINPNLENESYGLVVAKYTFFILDFTKDRFGQNVFDKLGIIEDPKEEALFKRNYCIMRLKRKVVVMQGVFFDYAHYLFALSNTKHQILPEVWKPKRDLYYKILTEYLKEFKTMVDSLPTNDKSWSNLVGPKSLFEFINTDGIKNSDDPCSSLDLFEKIRIGKFGVKATMKDE